MTRTMKRPAFIATMALAVTVCSAHAARADDTAAASDPAASIDRVALWKEHCTKCHGEDAKGKTRSGKKLKIKDYTDPEVRKGFDRDEMIRKVTEGVKDEESGKDRMEPMGEELSVDEIGALVDWILALTPTG